MQSTVLHVTTVILPDFGLFGFYCTSNLYFSIHLLPPHITSIHFFCATLSNILNTLQ